MSTPLKNLIHKNLDSFFGLKKHHKFISFEKDYKDLLREFEKVRGCLTIAGYSDPFRDSDVVPIRYLLRVSRRDKEKLFTNVLKNYPTQNYEFFPKIVQRLNDMSIRLNGELGWVVLSITKPRAQVYEHIDTGVYFWGRNRYHLVLQSDGSVMVSGGQKQIYKEGEVWWFNNKVPHETFNLSDTERIHIIFDLLPNNYFLRIKNAMLWVYWGVRPGRLWKYYCGLPFPRL